MRRLFVGILVLVVLVVLADRTGVWLTERQIEQRLQQRVDSEVQADVLGVPFLTQAIARELNHVVLTAETAQLSERNIDVRDATIDLRNVRITSTRSAVAGRVTARGLVPWQELEQQAQEAGLPRASLSATPDGEVRVMRSVQLAEDRVQASATAEVALDGQTLVVEPVRFTVEGASVELDDQVSSQLSRLLRLRIPTSALPENMRLDSLDVRAPGLEVRLVGSDVPLGQ